MSPPERSRLTATAAAAALAALLLPCAAGANGWRPPWACRGAVEAPGDRARYMETLRSGAIELLADNAVEADEVSRRYGLDPSGAVRTATEVLEDPVSREVIQRQLDWFRMVIEEQSLLRELSNKRVTIDAFTRNAPNGIETALAMGFRGERPPQRVEAVVLTHVWTLRAAGYRLVRRDGDRWIELVRAGSSERAGFIDGPVVDPEDGRYSLDIDKDIRAMIGVDPSSATFMQSRLGQVAATIARDSELVRLEEQAAQLAAPILDVPVQSSYLGLRASTLRELLGEHGTRALPLESFVESMQVALAATAQNIGAQRDAVWAMTTDDIKLLLQAPVVRGKALAEHPEWTGLDCIAQSEITSGDLVRGVGYLVGGIATVGVFVLGNPELAPLIWTGIGAVMTGLTAWTAVDAYARYREARLMAMTGVDGPGLVSRELVQVYQHKFAISLVATLLSGATTVAQATRILGAIARTPWATGRLYPLSSAQLEELARQHPGQLLRLLTTDSAGLQPEVRELVASYGRKALADWVRAEYPQAVPFRPTPLPVSGSLPSDYTTLSEGVEHAGILDHESMAALAGWLRQRGAPGPLNLSVQAEMAADGGIQFRFVSGWLGDSRVGWELARQAAGFDERMVVGFGSMRIARDGTIAEIGDSLVGQSTTTHVFGYPTGWRNYPTLYELFWKSGFRMGPRTNFHPLWFGHPATGYQPR